MTEHNAIIHEAISALKTLAGSSQHIYLKRGEMLLLIKESKSYGKSFRRWLIESGVCDLFGVKPLTLENNMRVVKSIGRDLQDMDIVPSRVESFLPYFGKSGTQEAYLDVVKECCLSHIPAIVYTDKLNVTKGNKVKPDCDHASTGKGIETWHKHKCCGQWVQEI